jgi:hypothetical protein
MKRHNSILAGLALAALLAAAAATPVSGEISGVQVSNLTSASATVTWTTVESTDGCVNYGLTTGLGQQACDPRPDDDVHSVLITGLSPLTTYYFEVVSGSETDDNGGAYYTLTTAEIGSGIPYVVFGRVELPGGTDPAVGAIVSLWVLAGGSLSHPLSTLADSNGVWTVNLGNLKDPADGTVFTYATDDSIFIDAEGSRDGFGGDSTTVSGSSPQDAGAIVLEAAPFCSIEPASIDFGTVTVGEFADTTFTITNTGGGVLSGSVGESCDHYEILSGGGDYDLGNGEQVVVTIRFAPAVEGVHNCAVETGSALCGDVSCTGTGEDVSAAPVSGSVSGLALHRSRPNPVSGRTELRFDTARAGHAHLAVYDVSGKRVRTLVDGTVSAGRHSAFWDGRDDDGRPAGSGVYLYRLEVDGEILTGTCALLR